MESYGRLCLKLWKDSMNKNNELYNKIDVNSDIIILKIDLEKFENDHPKQLKLFGDPSYNKESTIFTLEPIPSKYISIV